MKKNLLFPILLFSAVIFSIFSFTNISSSSKINQPPKTNADKAGLTLPAGFSASIVADNTGEARHIAVTKEGDLYIKLGSAKGGNGILFLQDPDQNGRYQKKTGFADYSGTEVGLKNGYLYASSNTTIYRYKLNDKDEVTDPKNPEIIVSGLLDHGEHNSKSFTFDDHGNLYVNVGAYSNSCQEQYRVPGSMGMKG